MMKHQKRKEEFKPSHIQESYSWYSCHLLTMQTGPHCILSLNLTKRLTVILGFAYALNSYSAVNPDRATAVSTYLYLALAEF